MKNITFFFFNETKTDTRENDKGPNIKAYYIYLSPQKKKKKKPYYNFIKKL